ncbi:unnamed protein product [Orchesella dallaii]|uniref:Uncharacterized protein n=1 Tax=Orchesella dallaii TaxID=48710 RepID=A0ABP1RU18_9HEXA
MLQYRNLSNSDIQDFYRTYDARTIDFLRKCLTTNKSYQLCLDDEDAYLKSPPKTDEFPTPSNLDEFLRPFADFKCFISVINHREVNFITKRHPISVWTPEPADITLKYPQDTPEKKILWTPKGFHKRKHISAVNGTLLCNNSRFMWESKILQRDTFLSTGLCLGIDLFSYSGQVKPWNCQVDVRIYPIPFDRKASSLNGYPQLFMRNPEGYDADQYFKSMIYSRAPTTTIFVTYETLQNVREDEMSSWVASIIPPLQPSNIAILHAIVSGYVKSIGKILSVNAVKVNILVPRLFGLDLGVQLRPISLKDLRSVDLLAEHSHASPQEALFWILRYNQWNPFPVPSETVSLNMENCKSDINMRALLNTGTSDANTKLAFAYTDLWFSIMKNVSIFIERYYRICQPLTRRIFKVKIIWDARSVAIEEEKFTINTTHASALNIYNNMLALRFVSCGKVKMESLAFLELVNVFDGYIWLCVSISVVILVPTIQYIADAQKSGNRLENRQLLHVLKHWLCLVKVLLEQGDPFPLFLQQSNPVRVLLSCVLLVAIVLSNAYKNTNVYNMIVPREPFRYQRFEELILNNFTIYSRIGSLRIRGNRRFKIRQITWNSSKAANKYADFGLLSALAVPESFEVFLAGRKFQIFLNNYNSSYYSANTLLITPLHPHLNTAVENRLKEVTKLGSPSEEFRISPENVLRFEDLVAKDEKIILEKYMEQCNKTALLLPSFMCQKYHRRLELLGRREVFVGKEIYTNPSHSFTLGGSIPLYIVKRLSGMEASGLWEWWTKIVYEGSGLTYEVNKSLRKPTLEGNVLVIFALLICGISVALLCLVIENGKRLYSQATKGICCVKQWCITVYKSMKQKRVTVKYK